MSKRVFSQSVRSEVFQSLRMAMPLIAANLVQSSSGFIGTLMIAHLGRDELAASALGWSVYITILVFFFGMLAATGILVSQSFGAKDKEGVRLSVVQSFWMSLLVTVPAIVLMYYAPRILFLSGQNHHILSLTASYLKALSWCMLPLGLLVVMEQFLIGISKTRLVLFISLVQVPFEILGTYAFVFGKFGLPACGVSGIGFGFAVVFTVASLFIAIFVANSKSSRDYHLFSRIFCFNKKYFKELLRVGWPIGLMNIIEVAAMSVVAFLMGRVGSNELAAQQITRQFWIVGMMFVFSIAQIATVRVGQAVGRNDRDAISVAAYTNMLLGCAFMACVTLIYFIMPEKLIGIDFGKSNVYPAQLMHYAVIFLGIAGVTQLFDNFRFIAVGALRGLKDTKVPMLVSSVAFWLIALPIAYWLAFELHLGGVGLWYGLLIGVAFGAIILVVRFHRLMKRIDISTLVTRSDS